MLTQPREKERFHVLLEEIHEMFKALAEGQQLHSEKLDKIDNRLAVIEDMTQNILPIQLVIQEHQELITQHQRKISKLEKSVL